jgi:hypothetical protein
MIKQYLIWPLMLIILFSSAYAALVYTPSAFNPFTGKLDMVWDGNASDITVGLAWTTTATDITQVDTTLDVLTSNNITVPTLTGRYELLGEEVIENTFWWDYTCGSTCIASGSKGTIGFDNTANQALQINFGDIFYLNDSVGDPLQFRSKGDAGWELNSDAGEDELDILMHIDMNTNPINKVENISFSTDSANHIMKDNATCIIMTGDTSTLNIC